MKNLTNNNLFQVFAIWVVFWIIFAVIYLGLCFIEWEILSINLMFLRTWGIVTLLMSIAVQVYDAV